MTDDSVRPLKDRLYHVFTLGATNRVSGIFNFIMFAGVILSVVLCVLTLGQSLENMLFGDRTNYFMDYFNSIYDSLNDPYFEGKIIYPAPVTTGYYIIGVVLEAIHGSFYDALAIRESFVGMASYILITVVTILGLYLALHKSKEASQKETIIFFMLAMLSFPMLFAIDRGNSTLIAVIFSLLFLVGHSSKNKKIRYLSYVSLGIAAGIKIYPALFGLLLLRNFIQSKKIEDKKELIICILIGAIVFLVPFIFFEGSLTAMFGNVIAGATGTNDDPWVVNISNVVQATFLLFGYENYLSLAILGEAISLIFLASIILYVLFYKNAEKWELVFMLSAIMISCIGLGIPYLLLYLLIPAWYFVNSNPVINTKNVIFALLLALALTPLPIHYLALSYIKGIFVWVIIVIILIPVFKKFINKGDRVNDIDSEKLLQ